MEKRSCRRYAVAGVTTRVLESAYVGLPQYSLPCQVENLGKGGVLFESNHQFKIGELLDIEIQGPNDRRPIFTEAQVRYKSECHSGYRYGVKFAEIDVQVLRQVRKICSAA